MRCKNSKVFEQKGDLLNFKANIDPMALLSRVKQHCTCEDVLPENICAKQMVA